jgi:hypothetical protein
MDENKRQKLDEHYKTHKPDNIGVEPSEEFLKFLWNSQIAAVAGDTRSFEVWPCTNLEFHLHEWLLAGWGMPIGELFDLEELSEICASTGRSTFFLASAPMNVRPLFFFPIRCLINNILIGTWSGSEPTERIGILLVAQLEFCLSKALIPRSFSRPYEIVCLQSDRRSLPTALSRDSSRCSGNCFPRCPQCPHEALCHGPRIYFEGWPSSVAHHQAKQKCLSILARLA